jgi:DNA repair protein RadD
MILRPYQEAAIQASRDALNRGVRRPLVCLPTGAGKGITICTLAHRVLQSGRRIVISVHTRELIQQLADTYESAFGVKPAVYAAGLNRKEIGDVTITQIQSAYRNPMAFGAVGLVLVDECDRIPADGEGQYRSFMAGLELSSPLVRVCGFTATPYRMGSGLVYGPDCFFDELVYDAGVRELIEQGYLSPIRSKSGDTPDLSSVHVRAGEYIASELEDAFAIPDHVQSVVKEMVYYGKDRKAWLVFVTGKRHGLMVQVELAKYGITAPFITGDTPDEERKRYVADYKDRKIQCMISIGILAVGFDAPHVDMVVLLRATKSPGLYFQAVGRGLRICEGKTDCLVLDAGGNIAEHGPIDTLNERIVRKSRASEAGEAPVKICPQCKEIVLAGLRTCLCGYEFPREVAKHDALATTEDILSCVKQLPVERVAYTIKQKPGHTPCLQATYYGDLGQLAREFISLDHRATNSAYQIGLKWIRQYPTIEKDGFRLETLPRLVGYIRDKETSVNTILELLPFTKCLVSPSTITLYNGGKYPTVLGRAWSNP